MIPTVVWVCFLSAALTAPGRGVEPPPRWAQFHGPQSAGYVAEGDLPVGWDDSDYAWRHDLGSQDVGSPVIAGDTLLLISLDGVATLLRASERFEKLGEIDLGAGVGATPAYAEGALLLRIGKELCCLATEST